jgi:hypothetical protein
MLRENVTNLSLPIEDKQVVKKNTDSNYTLYIEIQKYLYKISCKFNKEITHKQNFYITEGINYMSIVKAWGW